MTQHPKIPDWEAVEDAIIASRGHVGNAAKDLEVSRNAIYKRYSEQVKQLRKHLKGWTWSDESKSFTREPRP